MTTRQERVSRQIEETQTVPCSELYERDFYSWTQEQAKLLRAGRLDALDVANILEEIETLGRSERASLKSAYRLICSHLLKMKYQPERYTRSWYNTVDRERGEVSEILAENPGLRPSCEETFVKAYMLARGDAKRETSLPDKTFPRVPPFDREECERSDFLPDELRERMAAEKQRMIAVKNAKKGSG